MRTRFLPLFWIMVVSLSGIQAYAQEVIVRGQVKADSGESLPGVSIVVKGTSLGTTTDVDGNFSLSVSSSSVLVFSFVGFQTIEQAVANRSVINLTMQPDTQTLNEVVVIGYGEVKKSDLTGSVSSVNGTDLNAFPATNALQALNGRAAGVQVIQNSGAPGAPISVRIRGANSIQGSNEPLYVIDGFPYSGSPVNLNNADIQSIEVLKDASATAIYGSRGANGVVLITTRQGKEGVTRVDYEGAYSVQMPRKKIEMMNAREYAVLINTQRINDNLAPYFTPEQINGFGSGTDWQDEVLTNAPQSSHTITVSGGNDKTKFSISSGFFDQEGIVKGSDFKRYSIRANISNEISKKFSFNVNANLSRINSNRQNSGQGNRGSSLIGAMLASPPTLAPYNPQGGYTDLAVAYPFSSNVIVNPLNFINEQTDKQSGDNILLNTSVVFTPVKGLSIKVLGGIETGDERVDFYRTRNFVNSTGIASIFNSKRTSLLNENIITYTREFNSDHSLSATAVLSYQDFVRTTISNGGSGFVSDVSESFDIGAAAVLDVPSTSYTDWTLLSYLGRLNYSFKGKILLTGSFRADGSSRFAEGQKWGYFPSGAIAWKIIEERFMKGVPVVSDLKLRVGYGVTGNTAIDPYFTLNLLSSGKTVFNDALYTTYSPGARLPGDIKWETTHQSNVGLDLGVIDDRFRLTVDYYVKDTRDLLNTVSLPSSLGYLTTVRNVGEVRNSGIELGLDAVILPGEFRWNVSANIAFNRNEVMKLNDNADILGQPINVSVVNDNVNILRVGEPMGAFYGYIEKGFNEQGRIIYEDLTGDGLVDINDKTIIGNPNPKFIFGFNSTATYKNFELNLFLQGSQGNDIYNVSAVGQSVDYGFGLNMPRDVFENHWTPERTNAKYPKPSSSTLANVSDRFVEDGSFVRLRNILLAYNLPVQRIGKPWLRTAQLYISGQNVLTFTNYSWFDPEISSYGGPASIRQGIDHYSYPTAKSYTVGLRLGI